MAGTEAPFSFEPACDLQTSFWEHLEALRGTLFKVLWTIALGIALSLFFYTSILSLMLSPLALKPGLELNEIKHQQIVNNSSIALLYTVPHESYTIIKNSSQVTQKAVFPFTDRVSVERDPSNGVADDEGIASAIAEKTDTADEGVAAGRKLTEKGNTAFQISPNTYMLPAGSSLEISFTAKSHPLALLSPLEGMQTTFKICFWIGLAATSPLWLWFVGQFIYPALHAGERKLLLPFLLLSLLFLGIGALFAYFVTIPLTNQMLSAFNAEIGINLWSFSHYIDYTFLLLLANGLAFEIALVLFFSVHIGLLSADFMKSKRRHMIFTAFIIGALLTPPDVFTQFMLAIPLMGFYELSLLYARFRERRSDRVTLRS